MKVENFINKYKNNILNITIIILALIISNKIYKNQNKSMESLKQKKETELKKNEVLKNIIQLQKRLDAYKNLLSNRDISLVINNLSNIAKQSNIRIASIKPENAKEYPLYIKFPFSLNIIIDSYHTLGKFISEIESSSDVYIIESVGIRPATETQEADKPYKLNADLRLSAISWKD